MASPRGRCEFPAPKRLPLGPLMDFGYEDEVLFPFAFNVAKTRKARALRSSARQGGLAGLPRICIPGKAELECEPQRVGHPGKAGVAERPMLQLFKRFVARLPKPLPQRDSRPSFSRPQDGFRLGVDTGQRETSAAFFPADQNILDNPAPQKFRRRRRA